MVDCARLLGANASAFFPSAAYGKQGLADCVYLFALRIGKIAQINLSLSYFRIVRCTVHSSAFCQTQQPATHGSGWARSRLKTGLFVGCETMQFFLLSAKPTSLTWREATGCVCEVMVAPSMIFILTKERQQN